MESLYSRMMEFTQDGVYSYAFEDGRVLKANRGFLRILDLDGDPESVIGRTLGELLVYTEPKGLIRRLLERHGEVHGLEYHFKTLKGEDRWVLHDSFLVDDPTVAGRVAEAIIKDVTARKLAERRIAAEKERLEVTLRSIGDAVIATDARGRVTLLNTVAEDMTGWTRAEAIGRPIAEVFRIVHETTREPCEDPVARVLAAGLVVGLANHTVLIRRGGGERAIADSGAPIRDDAGEVVGVVLVFRDVTESRRKDEELRRQERRLRMVLDGMLDAFALHEILCDAAGQPNDYRFLYANRRFEEMTGLSVAGLVGKTVREVIPGIESRWIERYGRVALTGEPERFQDFSKDLQRHYEISAFCPEHGQFAVIFRDVTDSRRAAEERQALERKMEQAQKLESLGVLSGGIAHDFNNLLTGVLGNASLALSDLSPLSPARDRIEQIETSAQRAADLCRQLLAYSGKARFLTGPIDVSTLVREMGHLLQVSITKTCALKLDLADGLPAIEGDATQIRQIVMNLIINASEAIGPQNGVISVVTGTEACDRAYLARAYIDERLPEGAYVFVEVSDTGCGMDRDTLRRIFDPFFSTKFAGRGLGLAAVMGIVRAHRGAIRVYSEPGKGSTFKVLFPAGTAAAPAPAAAAGAPVEEWRGHGTVLVADDEETVRTVAKQSLEHAGFRVLLAGDGREAVDLFRARHAEIDATLLDLTMPRLSGEDAFREIRRIQPDAPVLFTSGYNEDSATERLAGKGLAGFIQKPYRHAELVAKIRQAIESRGPRGGAGAAPAP
jgi:PAS domain S-box-containing protein